MPDFQEGCSAPGWAVAGFAEAMGLSRFGRAGCLLEGIESRGGALRLNFSWEGVGRGVVSISPDDGAPAFARSAHLLFRFIGVRIGRPYEILMSRMAVNAGEATIDELARLAGFGPAAREPDEAATPPSVPFNPFRQWGQDDGWRRFVCDSAMERRCREAFEFDSDSEFIVHGDLECRFVAPGARVRLPGYFVYPFDLFSHTEAVGPLTDLDDRDVITDPSAKLEERVLSQADGGVIAGPVVVVSTCVPVVIAEDPAPVLARLAPVCPGGISYVTPVSPLSPSEMFMESFAGLRRDVLSREPVAGSAGLVGYRPGRALQDLKALLGSVGIPVTGAIVPLVTRRLLADVLSASAIVIAPGACNEDIFDRLVDGSAASGRKVLKPAFPWGISATADWLEAVADSLGKGAEARARAAAGVSDAIAAVAACRPENAVYLFVTDLEEMARFFDPLSPAGLPLIPTMCGLGLRSRLLVYCRSGIVDGVEERFANLSGKVEGSELVDYSTFSDAGGLERLMCVPDAAAAYSEMYFDYRVTRRGLPVFSSRIFEPGFDGAVRTVARFGRLARLPFYRRYSDHMRGGIS